ncbi:MULTISPECIES: DegV family protein [unclassified Sporosarcina]|uniref:DegV family protein n=1 Tax=unclassified Sporosarcina TaxID=2647733 RepID=UPI000C16D6FB|nr:MULTISPECIES: DegV family protein [unclassified Sporosarcina]PID04490.1 fatty acid-binding protein DegV [Sporosarcina sp. P30]PID07836.1 fatty acid-binding protein DegV [Sporosarcina sp. P31]PID10853.1 fatty acid-binding protein DegV [Sporosarcina sp. P32b]
MKKIAWITDSAAQLDEAFIQQHRVSVLPLGVVFEDRCYRESLDLTKDEFYDKLRAAKGSPKTSQPTIGEMTSLYEKLQAEGYDFAIAVHLSSGLSGTFESAQSAAKMTDFPVYPIDSKIGSFPMIKMIEMGNELFAEGKGPEEVVEALTAMTSNSKLSFIPGGLGQLHKSGRVSGTQAFLSNLLNIKVLISFENGKAVMTEKVRSMKRAKKHVTSLLRTDMEKGSVPEVAVIHCHNLKDANIWKDELLKEFPTVHVQVVSLSVCVAVHAGEGTTGLSWVTY